MASTSKRGSGSTTPRSYESTLAPGEQTALLNHEGESDFGINYHSTQASNGDTSPPDGMASLPTRLARSASQARKTARRSRRRDYLKSYSSRIKYYVPVLDWLPTYAPSNFIGDLTAAFTMTSLIVPQAMSYATNLAKLSPVNGLFGAAIPPIIYSLLGTCRQLSVGPEAALSLIIGEAITKFIAEEVHAHGEISDHEKMKLAAIISTVITLEAGLITFALGILRLGFLDAILSRALLRGFISAVGLVIFIAQLPPILGLDDIIAAAPSADSTISKLHLVVSNIGQTHALTALLSLAAFVVLICAKLFKAKLTQRRGFKFLSYIPEVLVVVIVSTVLTALFNWDQHGLKIIGTVSAGQTSFRIPIYKAGGYLRSCLGTSAVIAILGFLDSIVAAKDCAGKYDYPISPNRELVALGAANIVASFISGTVPGYGSITRSRLAGQTGARTPMASFLTGTLVLCVTFFLLKFLFYLPKAVLASIICVVVFSILAETPHDVKFFLQMEAWVDLGLMTMTFLLTFFVNVEIGIVVSLGLSLALCVRQSSVMRIKILGRVPGTQFYEPLDDEEEEGYPGEEIPGVLIVRIRDIALTFANAGALKERLRRLERYGVGKHHPSAAPTRSEASVIIFHLADVEDIDASALQLILEMTQSYVSKSVMVYWTHLQPLARDRLVKAGVLAISGEDSHQETVQAALNALNETVLTLGGL